MKQIEWDIIERRLEGGLSPDEEICFQDWYAESEENRNYYHKLETFYKENGFVKEITDQDVNTSWDKFSMQVKNKKDGKKRLISYWSVASVAACLLVGMFILFWFGQERGVVNKEGESIIVAGGNKAVLWLSNGEKIALENHSDEFEEASVKIVNSGSSLSYEEYKDTVLQKRVMNRVVTPRGGEYGITLADGTQVYLGALSEIEYPVVFGKKSREVRVSGEVYFNVARDTNRPFIVKTGHLNVEVLGTSFNVRDYADEDYVETTLVSGKVKVCVKNLVFWNQTIRPCWIRKIIYSRQKKLTCLSMLIGKAVG